MEIEFELLRLRNFSDDVRLERCEPAAISFADKQRRGVREAFDGCAAMCENIRMAIKQPFSLA